MSHNNNKICKLFKAIFSTHYNIFQPNFGILLIFKGPFLDFLFLLTRSKIGLLHTLSIIFTDYKKVSINSLIMYKIKNNFTCQKTHNCYNLPTQLFACYIMK